MASLERKIWEKFHIKRNDNLPYTGWEGDRNTLAELIGENFEYGAEIGVRKGDYSRVICKANPDIKMVCVDPYAPFGRTSQRRQDLYFKKACERLKKYNVTILRNVPYMLRNTM